MQIKLETPGFNARRYSKPWIGLVRNGKIDFCGKWVGEINRGNGSAGVLIIDVEVGDIVAKGIKDNRGNGTEKVYYKVEADGLREITKVEAYS